MTQPYWILYEHRNKQPPYAIGKTENVILVHPFTFMRTLRESKADDWDQIVLLNWKLVSMDKIEGFFPGFLEGIKNEN